MRAPSITIMIIGYIEENILKEIQRQLGTVFTPLKVTIAGTIPVPKKAYNPERQQYKT